MTEKYNIFIEGIPGSGKTTLLNTLAECLPHYNTYREGDISPVDLAWCAYMNEGQYKKALVDMAELSNEIQEKTIGEKANFITAYTKIITEQHQFYKYMEQYEIYGGRRDPLEFQRIIFQRFDDFHSYGNIFECSFFQNIIEELMLFTEFSDEQIVGFYKELIARLDMSKFKLIRLVPNDIKSCIKTIKCERCNEKAEETWYQSMISYLSDSPFGKAHGISNFEDMITHFKRRTELESKVIKLLPGRCCFTIQSKKYEADGILRALNE